MKSHQKCQKIWQNVKKSVIQLAHQIRFLSLNRQHCLQIQHLILMIKDFFKISESFWILHSIRVLKYASGQIALLNTSVVHSALKLQKVRKITKAKNQRFMKLFLHFSDEIFFS